MIGISSKEVEETNVQSVQKRRHQLRQQFWTRALEKFRIDGVKLFANISPGRDHWLNAGSGIRGCPFTIIFARNEARVELNLARWDRDENKWLFDQLEAHRAEIETAFGDQVIWKRLDDKKQSRITYARAFEGYDQENWPIMIEWLSQHIRKLETAFRQPLLRFSQSIPATEEEGDE